MVYTLRCDQYVKLPTNLPTDICGTSAAKWQVTSLACGVLLVVGLFLLRRWRFRWHKTLLTFHNLRAAVALLLLAINTLELARAFLPGPPAQVVANVPAHGHNGAGAGGNESGYRGSESNFAIPRINVQTAQQQQQQQREEKQDEAENDYIIVIIGAATLWNALAATLFTIMLMWYHRVVEVKKAAVFLYVSSALEAIIFFLRLFELAEIYYDHNIYELEPCLQATSALSLLALSVIDGFAVYKERYRPVYLEDYDKIGYKHTLATFYSKSCFWWLTPLLWFGYKEPLELQDLGQMRVEDSARAHYDQFLLIYKTAKVKNADRPPSLWLCYWKSSWRMFTLGGVLKLFGDLFALIGPLAIQQIVQYIETMYGLHFAALAQLYNDNNSNNNSSSGAAGTSNSSITPGGFSNPYKNSSSNMGSNMGGNMGGNGSGRSGRGVGDINHISMARHAAGSIWLSNSVDNVSNQIAAAAIATTTAATTTTTTTRPFENGVDYHHHVGTEVQIYYPSWLDLVSNGWAIAWLVLLAALTQGALSQASTHILNMTGIRIKTSLQGLIYRKTLLLNSSCIARGASGEAADGCADGAVTAATPMPQQQQHNALQDTSESNCQNGNSSEVTAARQHNESGLSDVGAITNLMSVDTLNIMSFFWIAHYVWAIPLKIAVVMYLLYLKLGISAVIGSFVCILTMTPLQFLIGKAMSGNMDTMAKYTDERLRKIHDTFVGIKIIKLNAWDDVFLKKICAAREKELKYLNKDSLYWTLMTILTHICSVLITFVTLAVYVSLQDDTSDNVLTASHLFSALALFQQLTVPLLIFPITVPIILSAVTSTKRLERFLLAREIHKQFEGIRHMARILSKSDASLDMFERGEQQKAEAGNGVGIASQQQGQEQVQVHKEKKSNERLALRIKVPDKPAPLAHSEPQSPLSVGNKAPLFNITDLHEDKPPICNCGNECLLKYYEVRETKRRGLLRNTPYVVIRPRKHSLTPNQLTHGSRKFDSWHRDSLLLKMPDDVVVSVKEGCFAWNPRSFEQLLIIKDVVIPKGQLTVIVGKNGSGKSSLLSALLMEMPLISGDMIWHRISTISYVPQQPWLLNASIRENIIFGESFRPKRYDFVLEACALKPDIELMPAADFTMIGERGINLSGGQRQRVALARALYSSANVVIMDDPLSSLDNEVARHVFEQSVKRMLLRANRTVILVTQQLNLVHQADYLIVMKDGRLQASGGYKDIEIKHPHIIAKWNAIIAKAAEREQQNNAAVGRTARERWQLFKNVSKLGLQRSISATETMATAVDSGHAGVGVNDAEAEIVATEAAENDDVLCASLPRSGHTLCGSQSCGSFTFTRKRSSVYGSRHLIYDVPLPLDECQTEDVIMRRRRRGTTATPSAAAALQQGRRPSSRASSRLSGISSTSTAEWQRRSGLTASCSSATSYASNNSSNVSCSTDTNSEATAAAGGVGAAAGPKRVHSWQPQTAIAANKLQHQPVTRNISSPADFCTVAEQQQQPPSLMQQPHAASVNDATLIADWVQATQPEGGFQQFLRRMSMRRSNKPSTVAVHRIHRPVSAANSILSISEETPSATATPTAILPSIELSSIATEAETEPETETETESWIANIEDEDAVSAASGEHKIKMVTNSGQVTATDATASNAAAAACAATAKKTAATAIATARPAVDDTEAAAVDAERKYGKIPAQIYLLYLRASGLTIVLVFFISALIWQGLRVYTDVWLQHWSDDSGAGSANSYFNSSKGSPYVAADLTATANAQQHEVTYYFRVYAAISCVCIAMAMISTPAGQLAGCRARRHLHDKLLQTIMRKSLHFFQVTPLGRIINRFSNDMAIIDMKIAATSQRLLQFTLLCLCAILINVSITPWFILLTLPICAAYYAIQKFYRCSARELQRIENSTNSPVISHLSETIQGVTTIRAYNQEARFTGILFERLEANTIAFTMLNTSNRWLGISLDYLGGVIVFVAIITALVAATISCSQQLAQLGTAERDDKQHKDYNNKYNALNTWRDAISPTPSHVGLAINYTLLMPIYLNWVVKLLADMEMYVGSVERIAYYAEPTTKVEIMNACAGANDEAAGADAAEVDASAGDDDAAAAVAKISEAAAAAAKAKSIAAAAVPAAAADTASSPQTPSATALPTALAVIERNDAERRASLHRISVSSDKRYKSVPISWPQRGDITFENVSLRYEGQRGDVIRNLNLHIPAGQRIGICGRTGSGKSSLALSLFGVLQTTSGRIRIDDVDIAQIHPDEIRTRLSIIPQDVHLFSATIRENLDPHGYYADLALWNCLELAQLKEFVNGQLPQALDTTIMDGGVNLSAGHRQLLCLARAILRGSVCLVLDEATSSLDSSTEKALLTAAHKAFRGHTILSIAHRLSTILDYDRIIVMENGRIVEDGAPLELQRRTEGPFYTLLHSGRPLSVGSEADGLQLGSHSNSNNTDSVAAS